jgi:hypothetical protein
MTTWFRLPILTRRYGQGNSQFGNALFLERAAEALGFRQQLLEQSL